MPVINESLLSKRSMTLGHIPKEIFEIIILIATTPIQALAENLAEHQDKSSICKCSVLILQWKILYSLIISTSIPRSFL